MQAPQSHQSSIKINFGEKPHGSTPLNLTFLASFFSTEQNTIKSELKDFIPNELPQTFFAFELVYKNGQPTDIANQLNDSDVIKSINECSPTSVTFYSIHNKVYAILKGKEISSILQEFQGLFAQLKNQAIQDNNKIRLKIVSHNDLARIGEILKERTLRGWFDSLHLEFGFVKTELNTKILNIILENILEVKEASSMTKAFKKLNLELNLASSRSLQEFPKLKLQTYPEAPKNQFAVILADAGIQNAIFYGFNPIVYLRGDLCLSGFPSLLYSIYK